MTTKDEIKNRISMALKDPILQQGFEIICRENVELEERIKNQAESLGVTLLEEEKKEKRIEELMEENRQLRNEVEDLRAYCNQIGKVKTEVLKAFEHIVAR